MASNPRRRLAEVQKPKPPPATDPAAYARGVLHAEAEAIEQLCSRIDGDFSDAVDRILACSGRVVVTGMGKPGFIAQKISATFASTGTPSLFLHPAEALHGDLGRLVPGDLVVALSNSGETEEILRLLPALKRLGAPIIAITGGQKSSLAAAADVVLEIGPVPEACPLGLAPTTSTVALLALDDDGRLVGIFTDGDLRRLVQQDDVDFTRPVSAVMGRNPRTIGPEDLAITAAEILREGQIDQLPVVDAGGRPVGLLDVQDLLSARLFG